MLLPIFVWLMSPNPLVYFSSIGNIVLHPENYGKDIIEYQNSFVKFALIFGFIGVADMIVSGEGEGPLLPSPKDVGMILAGTNPVCFDEVVSTLMGFDYKKIPSIILAQNAKDRLALINDETAIISSNSSQYDKKTIDMLSKSDLLYFTPSEGWKGHIEKI